MKDLHLPILGRIFGTNNMHTYTQKPVSVGPIERKNRAGIHASIHSATHASIHAATHASIHAAIHASIHAAIHTFLTCFLISLWSPLVAQAGLPTGVTLTIEPLIGFEASAKTYPSIHTHDRIMYGVRAIAGFKRIAAEMELTRAADSDNFINPTLRMSDTDDALKLGIRSTYQVLPILLAIHGRLGGQATRRTHEVTDISGANTKTVGTIKYSPYIGAGLDLSLGPILSLDADATVVINELNDMRRNDYQYTIGFAFHIL